MVTARAGYYLARNVQRTSVFGPTARLAARLWPFSDSDPVARCGVGEPTEVKGPSTDTLP